MKVYVPSQLHSYTGKVKSVEAAGATLDEALRDLDRRYPGLRFRIINEQDRVRDHIRIFVNGEQTCDIAMPLQPKDEVQIVGALSGGSEISTDSQMTVYVMAKRMAGGLRPLVTTALLS